jgi:hypothetical protein
MFTTERRSARILGARKRGSRLHSPSAFSCKLRARVTFGGSFRVSRVAKLVTVCWMYHSHGEEISL